MTYNHIFHPPHPVCYMRKIDKTIKKQQNKNQQAQSFISIISGNNKVPSDFLDLSLNLPLDMGPILSSECAY